jgi:DUF1680 family protein
MRNLFLVIVFLLFGFGCSRKEKLTTPDPFAITESQEEFFQWLPLGDVKPRGWILEQMQRDLKGFTGNLDRLVPDLILKDDIYGKDRLSKKVKNKDVGNVAEDAEWNIQYLWWNSETQSNWRDGYIRNAILMNSPEHLRNTEKYLERILKTQDIDGYLGIYDKDLRYHFNDENGELWAKTTLLRGLLACYEAGIGNRDQVLEAIERAVKNVMDHYPIYRSSPFHLKKYDGGVSHGLVFTDVLDRLSQLTGKEEYREYALFLYKDYSLNKVSEPDIQYRNIIDTSYHLQGHAVHSYEHLRTLAVAAWASGNHSLQKALDIYLQRIDRELNPSGGPVGDEWILGREADASKTGYEYCSLQEWLDACTLLMQKSGKAEFGDKIERVFFNAAQGARHPEESSVAYLKSDNSYAMMGGLNDSMEESKQTRYKYSPAHQDVAVCCAPNAGRITPYFVRAMWMRDRKGLVATLFGPCELQTQVNETPVKITEETNYPYDYRVHFTIHTDKAQPFVLKFRKPAWAEHFFLSLSFEEMDQYLVVNRTWQDGDVIDLEFKPSPVVREDLQKETYFTYGPLVLAHPIEGETIETRKYPLEGFRDVMVKPLHLIIYQFLPGGFPVRPDPDTLLFHIVMRNPGTGKDDMVELIPMGKTILRQVTFKIL